MFKKKCFLLLTTLGIASSLLASSQMYLDNPRTLIEPFTEVDLISKVDYNKYTLSEQTTKKSNMTIEGNEVKNLLTTMIEEDDSSLFNIQIKTPIAFQSTTLNGDSLFPSSIADTDWELVN